MSMTTHSGLSSVRTMRHGLGARALPACVVGTPAFSPASGCAPTVGGSGNLQWASGLAFRGSTVPAASQDNHRYSGSRISTSRTDRMTHDDPDRSAISRGTGPEWNIHHLGRAEPRKRVKRSEWHDPRCVSSVRTSNCDVRGEVVPSIDGIGLYTSDGELQRGDSRRDRDCTDAGQ